MGISLSVLDTIGLTPLVELSRFTRGQDGQLLVKLEYLNPGGSKKDRIARQIMLWNHAAAPFWPAKRLGNRITGSRAADIPCHGFH
jgi:hypothetical protein